MVKIAINAPIRKKRKKTPTIYMYDLSISLFLLTSESDSILLFIYLRVTNPIINADIEADSKSNSHFLSEAINTSSENAIGIPIKKIRNETELEINNIKAMALTEYL